jgi:hypothetical protein
MCDECRQYPHHPSCPNRIEPIAAYTCDGCREGINVGEEFVEINGIHYHYDCLLENCTVSDILRLVGIDSREAEEEDYGD